MRGTAGRIFSALAHAQVNVRMIDQGSSELNIIIGVNNEDFEVAVRAIYDIFVKKVTSVKDSNGYLTYKYYPNSKKITIYGNKGSGIQSYAKLYKNPFKYAVKSVSVNSTKVVIKKGKTFKLKTYVSPTNCGNKKVTVRSSNTKIATINSKGVIKGIKKGKCKITVTSRDGSLKSKTVTVTVK